LVGKGLPVFLMGQTLELVDGLRLGVFEPVGYRSSVGEGDIEGVGDLGLGVTAEDKDSGS